LELQPRMRVSGPDLEENRLALARWPAQRVRRRGSDQCASTGVHEHLPIAPRVDNANHPQALSAGQRSRAARKRSKQWTAARTEGEQRCGLEDRRGSSSDADSSSRWSSLRAGAPAFQPSCTAVAAAVAAPTPAPAPAPARASASPPCRPNPRRRGRASRRNRSARRACDPAVLSRAEAFYVAAVSVEAPAAAAPSSCSRKGPRQPPSTPRASRLPSSVPPQPSPRETTHLGGGSTEVLQFVERLLETCGFLRTLLLKAEYSRFMRGQRARAI